MNEKASLTDDQMNERTLHSIKRHQCGLKVLTGAALGLWLVAMVGSIVIIQAYFEQYKPKEGYILRDMEKKLDNAKVAPSSAGEPEKGSIGKDITSLDYTLLVMTRAVGIGMVLTAACVAVLSAGMLATIILVIWNRRVTLRQINANLKQISAQLKILERPDKN